MPAGALARSTEHAREAQALAESLGDEQRLGWALACLANRAWNAGEPDSALEISQRVLDIAIGQHDVDLQISANFSVGGIELVKGNYRKATERLQQVVETLEGDRLYDRSGPSPLRSVFSRERLVWSLAELGEFVDAMARGEEAVRIAGEVDHHHSLILAYRSLGLVSLRRGDVSPAIPLLERAVVECRDAQTRSFFDITAGHLGYAYALSGRLPEGVALLEEALADPGATGTTNHPLLLAYLGEAHLLAGRRDEALAVARCALDLAHQQKERGNEAWVLRLLGEIASQADPPDLESAQAHYSQALVRADELGMRPLVAHCRLGLGRLYGRTGDLAKAQEHLGDAATMYREMAMASWLARAEAELGAVKA
jgi:tetratricopeptide (TPR) repeat protein